MTDFTTALICLRDDAWALAKAANLTGRQDDMKVLVRVTNMLGNMVDDLAIDLEPEPFRSMPNG